MSFMHTSHVTTPNSSPDYVLFEAPKSSFYLAASLLHHAHPHSLPPMEMDRPCGRWTSSAVELQGSSCMGSSCMGSSRMGSSACIAQYLFQPVTTARHPVTLPAIIIAHSAGKLSNLDSRLVLCDLLCWGSVCAGCTACWTAGPLLHALLLQLDY